MDILILMYFIGLFNDYLILIFAHSLIYTLTFLAELYTMLTYDLYFLLFFFPMNVSFLNFLCSEQHFFVPGRINEVVFFYLILSLLHNACGIDSKFLNLSLIGECFCFVCMFIIINCFPEMDK